jgi:hypothetical protein
MRLVASAVWRAAGSSSSSSSSSLLATQAEFYKPRSSRTALDSMYEIDNIYDQRIKRRRRIDPTRELNYTPDHWGKYMRFCF